MQGNKGPGFALLQTRPDDGPEVSFDDETTERSLPALAESARVPDPHSERVLEHAFAFLALAEAVDARLTPAYASLREQLHRAGCSVVVEVARHAGKITPQDKANVLWAVQRPTWQSSAIVHVCNALGLASHRSSRHRASLLFDAAREVAKMTRRYRC